MTQVQNLLTAVSHSPLSPQVKKILLPLCQPVPAETIPVVRQQINYYLRRIQARTTENEFLDLNTAVQITDLLHFLLDDYPQYNQTQQALIIGAARYFIKEDDAEHDTHAFLGLDDDALVVNYVLDVTGHADQTISL